MNPPSIPIKNVLGFNNAATPTGAIFAYGAAVAPTSYLLCDGTAVSRTTYATLFGIIGTTYGTGNGSTTFNVPDLRGRAAIGKGTHADVSTLGNNDGAAAGNRRPKHKHTVNDPGHVHPTSVPGWADQAVIAGGVYNNSLSGFASTPSAVTGITVGPQTGAEPTDTPAYIVLSYIIRT